MKTFSSSQASSKSQPRLKGFKFQVSNFKYKSWPSEICTLRLRSGQDLKFETRPGYVFLLSVLFIGAIAMTAAAVLVILGIAASKSGLSFTQSAQALQNAETCVERALRSLRLDSSYAGDETMTLTQGSCTLLTIEGYGNANRPICAVGEYGQATRRLEVSVKELRPSGTIYSWQEVSDFSLCDE